nr:hypothetical transcript [Hymenolepis microstoma]
MKVVSFLRFHRKYLVGCSVQGDCCNKIFLNLANNNLNPLTGVSLLTENKKERELKNFIGHDQGYKA